MKQEDRLLKELSNSINAKCNSCDHCDCCDPEVKEADLGLFDDKFTALDHIDTGRGKTHPRKKKYNPIEANSGVGGFLDMWLPNTNKSINPIAPDESSYDYDEDSYGITGDKKASVTIPRGIAIKGSGGWTELSEDTVVTVLDRSKQFQPDIVAVRMPDGSVAKVYRKEFINAMKK